MVTVVGADTRSDLVTSSMYFYRSPKLESPRIDAGR